MLNWSQKNCFLLNKYCIGQTNLIDKITIAELLTRFLKNMDVEVKRFYKKTQLNALNPLRL